MSLSSIVSVYSVSCRGEDVGEEGWKQRRRFLNNEKQMTVFFHLQHLCVCASVFSPNFIANTFGWPKLQSAVLWQRWHNTQKVFLLAVGLVFQSLPSLLPAHPSVLPPSTLARPCSGLHRGERVWDGVAVGLTGKQRFSPASKTSSRLSGVVPNVMKQCLGRLFFSPAHWIEARSHSL